MDLARVKSLISIDAAGRDSLRHAVRKHYANFDASAVAMIVHRPARTAEGVELGPVAAVCGSPRQAGLRRSSRKARRACDLRSLKPTDATVKELVDARPTGSPGLTKVLTNRERTTKVPLHRLGGDEQPRLTSSSRVFVSPSFQHALFPASFLAGTSVSSRITS